MTHHRRKIALPEIKNAARGISLLFMLTVGLAPPLHAVDTGGCGCTTTGTFQPGENTAAGNIRPDMLPGVSASGPASVYTNQWFKVTAEGGIDCDVVKGAGAYCVECGPGEPHSCSGGFIWAHDDKNVDKVYQWLHTWVPDFCLPSENEEAICPGCPYFKFDIDPFIWLKAPETPGIIFVGAAREPCEAYNDGIFPPSTYLQVEVLAPIPKGLSFYANGNVPEADVDAIAYSGREQLVNPV